MVSSDFTLRKVKQDFALSTVEDGRFLPKVELISPSPILAGLLEETIPWAIAKNKASVIVKPQAL